MGKWKDLAGGTKGGGGDSRWVNLKDGDTITFAVMGDPGEAHLLFPEGGGRPTSVKAGTPGAQHKIGIPIYDVVQKAPRLLQITRNTFDELAGLLDELGEDRVFRISRKGKGLTDTRYNCSAVDRVDDALRQTISRETPVALDESGYTPLRVEKASQERQPGDETEKPSSDIPF